MKRVARFQQTLASQASFTKFGRKSKRELFLDQMNQVVTWYELLALVEFFTPRGQWPASRGSFDYASDVLVAEWFSWSDPCMEEAFYESR